MATPIATEFQVNTYTTSSQRYPAIAYGPSGEFVVTWQSLSQDGDVYGIYAQRYSSTGSALGSEFQVNSYTTDSQRNPAIAFSPSGEFVVTWQSNGQDGSGYGIYAQRYSSTGSPLGGEFRVNTYTTSNQSFPAIAFNPLSSEFVVTWTSAGQDGSSEGIYAQRYSSTGSVLGSEFRVNTYTTNVQALPVIAYSPSGQFAVAWQSNGQDGNSYGIYAQRFEVFALPEVNLSVSPRSGRELAQTSITVTATASQAVVGDQTVDLSLTGTVTAADFVGGMVPSSITIQSGQTIGSVTLQIVDDGLVEGAEAGTFAIANPSSGLVLGTTVAQGFSIGDNQTSAGGNPVSGEFQVNTYTNSGQDHPAIAFGSNGEFVVAWESNGQDGNNAGIYAQRFSSTGSTLGIDDRDH
ncbi:MAG: hypothetical protein HC918_14765, partial [Oscillatoriales cyanobacterium SM2_1_8]|nr:hypothetical protein [Oscillatoriales cyanobacterium SM2_1_8]